MKKIINFGMSLLKKHRHFVLYAFIGTFSASLDFLIFTLLLKGQYFSYLISNVISVNCGILTSFLLNRHFNFKVKNRIGLRLILFYSVGLLGLGLSTALLWAFVEQFAMYELWAKIFSLAAVVLMQFLLNKYITFKIHTD